MLGGDGLVSTAEDAASFLDLDSSLRVAFSAGLTEAGFEPVADLAFADVDEVFEAAILGLLFGLATLDREEPFLAATLFAEPDFVNPLLPVGLLDFALAAMVLPVFFEGLPLLADFDLLGLAAEVLEAAFFFATGLGEDPLLDESPLVAGFLTGFGLGLFLPAFLVAGFRAVFFLDALATAFTNRC